MNKAGNGMDLDHLRLTLKELAKFHAVGFSYINNFPNGSKSFEDEYPRISFLGKRGLMQAKSEETRTQAMQLFGGFIDSGYNFIKNLDEDRDVIERYIIYFLISYN